MNQIEYLISNHVSRLSAWANWFRSTQTRRNVLQLAPSLYELPTTFIRTRALYIRVSKVSAGYSVSENRGWLMAQFSLCGSWVLHWYSQRARAEVQKRPFVFAIFFQLQMQMQCKLQIHMHITHFVFHMFATSGKCMWRDCSSNGGLYNYHPLLSLPDLFLLILSTSGFVPAILKSSTCTTEQGYLCYLQRKIISVVIPR